MTTLKIYRLDDSIPLPAFQTEQSACFDIAYNCFGKTSYEGYGRNDKPFTRTFNNGNLYIGPHERVKIPTGLILDIPEGYSVRCHPRSSMAYKNGLTLVNAEGVIDSDFVHELTILIYNMSDNGITIANGDRIMQAELVKLEKYSIDSIGEPPKQKTSRSGGIGSTGKKSEPVPEKVIEKTTK